MPGTSNTHHYGSRHVNNSRPLGLYGSPNLSLHLTSRRLFQAPFILSTISHHMRLESSRSTVHQATVAAVTRSSSDMSRPQAGEPSQHRRKQQRQSPQLTESTNAIPLSGPGLPLLLGLKQLPAGAGSLLGWQVRLSSNNAVVGTVRQVQCIQDAYHLLRVHKASVLQPYGFKGREVHSIPLVPDIVRRLHPQQRVITITPPTGLLDLGQRELLLSFLSIELQQYTTPQLPSPAGTAGQPLLGIRCMPTQQQLVQAGRSDLVGLISKVGGFTEAALLLGLRATRRPAGYWDSLEVLDAELNSFIAGSWMALPTSGDDELYAEQAATAGQQYYFYNMATKRIRWQLPAAARALLPTAPNTQTSAANESNSSSSDGDNKIGDVSNDQEVNADRLENDREGFTWQAEQQQGGLSSRAVHHALMALADDRIMPSRTAVTAAARWDLDTAIRRNGGYREVAQLLNRRPSWPVPKTLTSSRVLAEAIAELAAEQGWEAGVLPTLRQLRQAGRDDIIMAVTHHGGWAATAAALELRSHRQPAAITTAHSTAAAVLQFMATHPPPERRGSSSANSRGSSSSNSSNTSSSASSSGLRTIKLDWVRRKLQQQRAAANSLAGATAVASAAAAAVAPMAASHNQWTKLPTQRQLLAARRPDIVYGLRRHGYDTVRRLVGLPEPQRKKLRKGVLQWDDVQAALQAGCHTIPTILAHITHLAGQGSLPPKQKPQTRAAGQEQNKQGGEPDKPLVAREHLARQLKVWCGQGRVVKPKTGWYELPAVEGE